MRVLHVIRQMNRGGAETMIMNLYRNIDREKVQFDFLLHTEEPGLFDEEIRSLGGRIYSVHPFNGLNGFSYYWQCMAFFRAHPEIKVVHGHLGSCAALYLKAAKACGCYTIAHSHAVSPKNSLRDLLFSLYSYPTRRIADWFFGCSTEAGISRFGKNVVCSAHYSNLNNAIDLDRFRFRPPQRAAVRSSLGYAADTVVIGTVGRITAAKNPDLILETFRAACSLDPRVRCLWIGSGDLAQVYLQKASDLRQSDRLFMAGDRDDIPALLSAMDVYILPSFSEGLPVGAIEAQSMGAPCLISDVISKEVDITPLVKRMSIHEPPLSWAETALALAEENKGMRQSPAAAVHSAGYDIRDTARKLAAFYLAHGTPS